MKQKQINQGWKEFELGEICEINPKKSEVSQVNKSTLVSFVPMADLNEKKINFDIKDSRKIGDVFSGYTYFGESDVLLAKVTPCFENGKSGVAKNLKNKIGFGSSEFHVLRAKESILPELIYFIISDNRFIGLGKRQMSGTGGLKRLSLNYVKKYPIYLPILPDGTPDLKKQKQIVAILEKAEGLKDKRKGLDELFDEYLKSVFYEMFLKENFEEKELNKICNFIDYRGKTPKKTDSGIKLITAKNVKLGYINDNPEEFIAEEDYESWMTRGFPNPGDVLFTTEAPLGNVAVLGQFKKIALAQRIITLQCNSNLNSIYLMYFLLSPNFQNRLKKDTTGSTVRGIRSKEFKKIKIPLPPLPLQKKFASIVEQIEKIKGKLKDEKKDADELFNALMQKAFSGELI